MNERPARPRVVWRAVDGILLLDKPVGLSSNQALQRARRLYRAAKAGHTGSLDPLASGILPLCFGEATKVAGLLLDGDKTYRATLALGVRTSTGDREGEVVETCTVPRHEAASVVAVMSGFLGAQQQVPPMYSALKREGVALYALARRGIEVDREPRPIRIDRLVLEEFEPASIRFSVTCSKGTYIRTLGEDIARALGCCGHLTDLARTEISAFEGRTAIGFEALEAMAADEAALDALLLPLDAALNELAAVHLTADAARRFGHGQRVALSVPPVIPAGRTLRANVRVYGPRGFLGLGAIAAGETELLPVRLLARSVSLDS